MHELGLAIEIVDVVAEEAAKLGAVRVTGVRLRVGALAGVVKEALLFSFDAATAGTPLEGARLSIEDVPVVVWCPSCAAERALADAAVRRCPTCDAVAPRLVRGDEMQLTGLEICEA
jgi:hydrogenase nickel incorporation protein HypA/HybF